MGFAESSTCMAWFKAGFVMGIALTLTLVAGAIAAPEPEQQALEEAYLLAQCAA